MSYPKCFESQQQFDDWIAADRQIYTKVNHTAYCVDCTPAYAAVMRADGRCEHPEVRFYRNGRTYMGRLEQNGFGIREKVEEGWELVNEEEQPNGPLTCANA